MREDGSLQVTETIAFEFAGEPFTFVFRELETDLTDGIRNIRAFVDGRTLPEGEESGQVEISGEDPIRVEWHLEPFSNQVRTFTLEYEMLGVVRQEEDADLLVYQPLPDEYEYSIDSSTVVFEYPASAEIRGDVEVTTDNGQWQRSGNEVIMTAQELEPEETIVVEIPFAPGSLIAEPPAWQRARIEQREAAPLWIAIAAGVFALGVAVLVVFYRPYRRAKPKVARTVLEPPSDMAPALAGAIRDGTTDASWDHTLGTLFDLADRGVLRIEEVAEKKWYRKRDFVIEQLSEPVDPRPHEQGLLQALFETEEGLAEEVRLSELSKRLSSKQWKRYEEPLKQALKAAGFVDSQRKSARSRFNIVGVVLILFGFAIFMFAAISETFLAFIPAGAVFLLGIVSVILGSMISPLTDLGATTGAEWQRFADYLKEVSKGKAAVSGPDMFSRFLPYAAAFGMLQPWAKWFEEEGWTELPPYFQPLAGAGEGGAAAFVAMAAASSSAGGSAAGAAGAGAGAAGGGGSGAG